MPSGHTSHGGTLTGPKKRRKQLLLDEDALKIGESFCRRTNVALSRLVSDFLRSLPGEGVEPDLSPVMRRLYGIAAGGTAGRDTYREYLVAKYGTR